MDDDYFTMLSPPPVTVTEDEIANRFIYTMPSLREAKVSIKLLIDTLNTFMQAVIMIDSINPINIYMIEDTVETISNEININARLDVFGSLDMESAKILKSYFTYTLKAIGELLSSKDDPDMLLDDSLIDKLIASFEKIKKFGLPATDQNADRMWSSHMDMSKRRKTRRRR